MALPRRRQWGIIPLPLHIESFKVFLGLTFCSWNSYNHYSCAPNESIIHSNAKALVDLGLADLGYRYVTTDCGWTVADRTANGSLTWNETLFPSGFPALGEDIHDLGLLFGVYEDAGIRTCQTDMEQAGSLCMFMLHNKT